MRRVEPERCIAELCPPQVSVVVLEIATMTGNLLAGEDALVAQAGAVRRQEFTAGRHAARLALGQSGVPARPILADSARVPIWPDGFIGSISHGGGLCAALICRDEHVRAIGLDIEPDEGLEVGLWNSILTAKERHWLEGQPAEARAGLAKLVFSIKESAYKCQFPLSGEMFGFDGFEVMVDPTTMTFDAVFTRNAGAFSAGDALSGRYGVCAGIIAAVTVLP